MVEININEIVYNEAIIETLPRYFYLCFIIDQQYF